MDIVLLGEFSGFNKNLNEGLRALGHNSRVIASGDGWKNIDVDILIKQNNNNIIEKLKYRYKWYHVLSNIKKYDIVQLINPWILRLKFFPSYYIIKSLLRNNKKTFLSAAGDDAYYWKYGRKQLRYGPFEDSLKYDIKKNKSVCEKPDFIAFNQFIADNCKGIIPISYEYAISYKIHNNCRKFIPLPINTDSISYSPNIVRDKIVIFHGLNRYGSKGTRFIEKAFKILQEKYPHDLELIIDGKMPLNIYLDVMRRTNVVVDQTYGYSCGMNAIYALAMGKIVMGGAEPESLALLGVDKSPIINILPDVDDIVRKVEWILDNKNNIEKIGYEGRAFVEENHNYIKIAEQYIDVWNNF
ncbi:putative glycosyltransferase [Treponema primitia ZAS-2]|uniref:Putative glycosyltransferase n=2 Tax=Treponema primitia TaxID=88058 RepID=F5YN41_TREPZ|nr:putative glycosyltransferase [Treponema primitia ZAS-2]